MTEKPLLLLKDLKQDDILNLWDWHSGEILATDIIDFAQAYWLALSELNWDYDDRKKAQ